MQNQDTTYNGWTNYETWAVKLWIDNEEGTQRYWEYMAREAVRRQYKDRAKCELADELRLEHEEAAPDIAGTVYSDLMNAALSSVNWYEIAENIIGDLEDDEDEDDEDEDEDDEDDEDQ